MKKIMALTAALSLATLLAGCDSKSDANENNFSVAISDYLDKDGDICLNIKEWPVDLSTMDIKLKDGSKSSKANQMSALESAGLVKSNEVEVEETGYFSTTPIKSKVKRYTLTLNATPFIREMNVTAFGLSGHTSVKKPFLCWGKKRIKNIIKWEGPTTSGTQTKAIVTYTYKIDSIADWAKNEHITTAFPHILSDINNAKNGEHKIALYLSNIGWEADR